MKKDDSPLSLCLAASVLALATFCGVRGHLLSGGERERERQRGFGFGCSQREKGNPPSGLAQKKKS
jgi:hypothetical protein